MTGDLPLSGTLVLDLTRMLPGAVLARTLVDLGARVVKVEDPAGGDPMRALPPLVDGIGAGFAAFFRGTESICLDLRSPNGAAALRRLARHADVLVESFRPGTLEGWGLSLERLAALNPVLVTCSLSSFGREEGWAGRVGHDLNFTALTGLLSQLPGDGVPRVQLADVTAGLLAGSSILAALLVRARTGRGGRVEQPLAAAPLPFLTWTFADASAGGGGVLESILAGTTPAYRVYACADGARVALGAIEPKFWLDLVNAAGLPALAGDGFDAGERGEAAVRRLAEAFAGRSREAWLRLAEERGLPLTSVNDLAGAMAEPYVAERSALPYLPSFAPASRPLPVPRLGEGTGRVLKEIGLSDEEIEAL